jgi:hypothetical protein
MKSIVWSNLAPSKFSFLDNPSRTGMNGGLIPTLWLIKLFIIQTYQEEARIGGSPSFQISFPVRIWNMIKLLLGLAYVEALFWVNFISVKGYWESSTNVHANQ